MILEGGRRKLLVPLLHPKWGYPQDPDCGIHGMSERKEGPPNLSPIWQAEVRWCLHLCFACTWSADLWPPSRNSCEAFDFWPRNSWALSQCLVLGARNSPWSSVAGILMVCDCSQQPCCYQALGQDPVALVQLKLLKLSTLSEKMIPSLTLGICTCLPFTWMMFLRSQSQLKHLSPESLHWLDRRTKHPNCKSFDF